MRLWNLYLVPEAESDMNSLGHSARERIFDKLEWLEENFDAITPIPLFNVWRGFFKLRVGDYRVAYKIK